MFEKTPLFLPIIIAFGVTSCVLIKERQDLPLAIGQCSQTTVSSLGTRLQDSPGSGTSISFSNGIYLVAYDTIPEAEVSRVGDRVTICLTSTTKDCPLGDGRGKFYSVINLKTEQGFKMSSSSHGCGGA